MAASEGAADLAGYLDACATAPPHPAVLRRMAEAHAEAWANPSSLHGFGIAAAECLERSRQALASLLEADPEGLIFCSGASEAIHLALLGHAGALAEAEGGAGRPGRVVISAVEHPATLAACAQLRRRGWQVAQLPVDRRGIVRLEALPPLLEPPTRLLSLIWGQSEVGALQPVEAVGALCRRAGVCFHVDAVQVVGHAPLAFDDLPLDLLSCTAHKLGGPRGIGLLLRRRGVPLAPLVGGAQEGGLRGGTEPVALAAGFAEALRLATARLAEGGGRDPLEPLRDALLQRLLALPGVALTGPDPGAGDPRLPHHISLVIRDARGEPLPGRSLVRQLWRRGLAVGSGSACSARSAAAEGGSAEAPSPGGSAVLQAMGYAGPLAAAGLRISLGPWLRPQDLEAVPALLAACIAEVQTGRRTGVGGSR